MNGTSTVGIVTWLLIGDIVVLSVLAAVAPLGCAAIVAGWVTACVLAVDLAGAVLDRFGVLGGPGSPGVSWGSWPEFSGYTATLLHHPGSTITTLAGWAATCTEVTLAVLLVSGWQRRWVAKATAGLFVVYTIALAFSSQRVDLVTYAMPVLVGGALVLSATPVRRRRVDVPSQASPVLTESSRA
jgi:uncharacterized membrane protein YphA (DoxX/SURF4 family)